MRNTQGRNRSGFSSSANRRHTDTRTSCNTSSASAGPTRPMRYRCSDACALRSRSSSASRSSHWARSKLPGPMCALSASVIEQAEFGRRVRIETKGACSAIAPSRAARHLGRDATAPRRHRAPRWTRLDPILSGTPAISSSGASSARVSSSSAPTCPSPTCASRSASRASARSSRDSDRWFGEPPGRYRRRFAHDGAPHLRAVPACLYGRLQMRPPQTTPSAKDSNSGGSGC